MSPRIFTIRKKRQSRDLCVRDLRPGMVVTRGDKQVTVKSISIADPPRLIAGGRPSALALEVEFHDHGPVIAHPAEVVQPGK